MDREGISREEKIQRTRNRKRKAYLNLLAEKGKETKEVQIIRRRNKLRELLSLGMSQKEICQELSISRTTYYEDKRALGEGKEELSSLL
jgi:DNA invertase Pin-like site-specific DNA recombinase